MKNLIDNAFQIIIIDFGQSRFKKEDLKRDEIDDERDRRGQKTRDEA